MSTIIDTKLTPRENFVVMINQTAKYQFKGDEFIISPATAIDPKVEWAHGKNTMVMLEAVPGSGFVGEKTLFYNRCNLREQVDHTRDASEIVIYHFYDLEVIKQSICRAHSIIPEEIEIVGTPPKAGDRSASYLLKAKLLSLLYNGEVRITIDMVLSAAVIREIAKAVAA